MYPATTSFRIKQYRKFYEHFLGRRCTSTQRRRGAWRCISIPLVEIFELLRGQLGVPGGMLHNDHALERIGGQPRQQIDPCLGC
jgi:hypothetical protein